MSEALARKAALLLEAHPSLARGEVWLNPYGVDDDWPAPAGLQHEATTWLVMVRATPRSGTDLLPDVVIQWRASAKQNIYAASFQSSEFWLVTLQDRKLEWRPPHADELNPGSWCRIASAAIPGLNVELGTP